MLIPDFIERPEAAHQVLPTGIHDATIDEIEEKLVVAFPTSTTRRLVFDGWQAYRTLIRGLITVRRELLDGSFVTNKVDPKDADLSFWVDANELNALGPGDLAALSSLVHNPGVMGAYRCDAYLVPECAVGHPDFPAFQGMLWTDGHWRAVRDKNGAVIDGVHKGYVRVVEP